MTVDLERMGRARETEPAAAGRQIEKKGIFSRGAIKSETKEREERLREKQKIKETARQTNMEGLS